MLENSFPSFSAVLTTEMFVISPVRIMSQISSAVAALFSREGDASVDKEADCVTDLAEGLGPFKKKQKKNTLKPT